ncbi:MAG: hypothetical protein OXR73_19770 [Myxococcales bacterium]|nr:hypothetical protein [Myxococcales bacterium]
MDTFAHIFVAHGLLVAALGCGPSQPAADAADAAGEPTSGGVQPELAPETGGEGPAPAAPVVELAPQDLDECVSQPAPQEPGFAYVTSPDGWRVKTPRGATFQCGDEFSSVTYREGLAALINVQKVSAGDKATPAQRASSFALAVRNSWRKQHPGQQAPKLLGHKVGSGKHKRSAVCLELPEPDDESVKIGCVTALDGLDRTIVYHYSQFYLKRADFDQNRDAAWDEVRALSGEWTVVK